MKAFGIPKYNGSHKTATLTHVQSQAESSPGYSVCNSSLPVNRASGGVSKQLEEYLFNNLTDIELCKGENPYC